MVSPDPPFFYAIKYPFYQFLKKTKRNLFVFHRTGTFFNLFTKQVNCEFILVQYDLFVYICLVK